MRKLRIVGIAAFVAAFLISWGVAYLLLNRTPEKETTREETIAGYIDQCIEGGGEYGRTLGFYDYCKCTYIEAEGITRDYKKVNSYVAGLSDTELEELAEPCFKYID